MFQRDGEQLCVFLILHDRLLIPVEVGWEDQLERRFQLGSDSLTKKNR